MIPIRLRLSGFLSYRDPVEVDFSSFDLACICGSNGAGKSSLLDAITWALFGQARKRDEALINTHKDVKAAEVIFDFTYEGNIYRVQRTLPRGKQTMLEFQIQQPAAGDQSAGWRPLTERTNRETQARIEHILRLDYDTFINAAFFLQGKADQFAQQSSGRRKDILSNILGLEVWEIYKESTVDRRRAIERDLLQTEGHMAEIDNELAEEPVRTTYLAELEARLSQMTTARKVQETTLENIKRVTASLAEQRKMVETLASGLERTTVNLAGLEARLVGRETEQGRHVQLLDRAAEVEAAYHSWQTVRVELERWESVAEQFREHEKRRQPLLEEISNERARLEEEMRALKNQANIVSDQQSAISGLQSEIDVTRKSLAEVEAKLSERAELDTRVQTGRSKQADLRAENQRLKNEMDEIKARMDQLKGADGAICPLCGQPLAGKELHHLIDHLKSEGKDKGDTFRANKLELDELAALIAELEKLWAGLSAFENKRISHTAAISQLTERFETLQRAASEWASVGARRLREVEKLIKKEFFATEARLRLAEVDKELSGLGYDAKEHDAVRRKSVEGRSKEIDFRALETARAVLKPLEDEIANLGVQIKSQRDTVNDQQTEYEQAAAGIKAAESQTPDLESAEQALYDIQEQENRLNQEVGAARQKVTVLDELQKRRLSLEAEAEDFRHAIGRHKQLERAFGRDGVPALLIEQALPEIEVHANDLLDRLSDGSMSIRFMTQQKYKDERREDLKETLDILISDGSGTRDYETFSGGEAFRVNFAIRLALSRLLAQRKGARLQTLVIDEGFGSQDTQGRQRLIEAINAVKRDFAKILVITHLDELKDAFPNRIEVEKTERGSRVVVT